MKTVISASRRTDIPAFYLPWLIHSIQMGFADIVTPRGMKKRVDLHPDRVHAIVLWSKNFRHFLSRKDAFQDYNLYFHFTLNDCLELEPNIPSLKERLAQGKALAESYGPGCVNWRFDPVVFWDKGRRNNTGRFAYIAEKMAGIGIHRCTFSFCTHYRKTVARTRTAGVPLYDPPLDVKRETAARLGRIARDFGIELFACSQSGLAGIENVSVARCIDGAYLQELFLGKCSQARDVGQRPQCHCTKSVDIGSYALACHHGCLYCYASPGLAGDSGRDVSRER
ncbi:MAG TPA: DUF1848 family protein [Candidatus Omnitrophota bacterium]|nr:DUF1848 family protein [Candidatus Omnitrophota bacterium]